MREARRTDLATVWAVGTVGNEVNTHLALRRLDGAVSLPWGNRVTLAKELRRR